MNLKKTKKAINTKQTKEIFALNIRLSEKKNKFIRKCSKETVSSEENNLTSFKRKFLVSLTVIFFLNQINFQNSKNREYLEKENSR